MAGTTALVTGAAGLIGSHVVDELIARGRHVIAMDDLSGGFRENVHPHAEFVEASVTDVAAVQRVLHTYKPTHVFHLAAYAAEGLSHFIRHFNYTNNLLGSVNLINASVTHGVECFVFTSSIAVYGKNQLPMSEDMVPLPEDPYGIAKYAVELDLRCAHELFGLNYVIFRPHNVYGERQNIGDPYRNVIGIFMNQAMRDEPMTIYGDGSQTRAFSYISDVAPVIASAPETPASFGRVFNVGADEPYSVTHLAERVASHINKPNTPIIYLPGRKEVLNAYASHKAVTDVFNCKPLISLDAGLARMATWALRHGARKGRPFKGVEVPVNMPSHWAAMVAE